MNKLLGVLTLVMVGCGGGAARETNATIGKAGGALSLSSGVELRIPPGALSQETEIHLREVETGGRRHIEMVPHGLRLNTRGELEVRIRKQLELKDIKVREGKSSGEIESRRRRDDSARHALEIEIEHLSELEIGDDKGTDTRPDDSSSHRSGSDRG